MDSVPVPNTSPSFKEKISSIFKDPMKSEYYLKVLIGFFIILIAINLSIIVIYPKLTAGTKKPEIVPAAQPSTVSGNIDLNGFIPKDAIIEIGARRMGDTDFRIVAGPIEPIDGASFVWENAENGSTYEIKAIVKQNNQQVLDSPVLAVTAPSTDETLRIVSTLSPTTQTTAQETTTISGKLDINGYVPPNATVTITAKKSGDGQAVPIITNLSASDNRTLSWNSALKGVSYEFQGFLYNGGTLIGQSQILKTAGPAANEVLIINSTAQGPVSQSVISGNFNINGPIPSNSSIQLSFRKSGTPTFSVVQSGIAVVNNATWQITVPQGSVSYDILAYLQVGNVNQSQSQLLVVTAPAQNEVLTINIANQPSAPPQSSITYNCSGPNNSNQWQINVQYNQNNVNPGAQAFILQLGSNSGASDIFNIQTSPGNPSQVQNYTSNYVLNQGQTYFLQYAYSTCQSCTSANFYSQFSSPIQVRCTTNPTNTPTSTPTNTPIPTNSPIPTSTTTPSPSPSPTNSPTPSPKIAQCNESCGGSSGYSCADPLTCFDASPGVIGGDVCRNSSCTDKTNCTCE